MIQLLWVEDTVLSGGWSLPPSGRIPGFLLQMFLFVIERELFWKIVRINCDDRVLL